MATNIDTISHTATSTIPAFDPRLLSALQAYLQTHPDADAAQSLGVLTLFAQGAAEEMSPEDNDLVCTLQLAVPQSAEDERRLIAAKRALRAEPAAATTER